MKSKRHGFTIAELLVVVAIIAVLFALLLPIYNKAKVKSQTARCINNLRQIHTASTLYSNENRGEWPINTVGSGGVDYADSLRPYFNHSIPPVASSNWRNSPLVCPADRFGVGGDGRWQRDGVSLMGSPQIGYSYAQNAYLYNDSSYRAGPRSAVEQPGQLAAYMDWEGHYLASPGTLSGDNWTRRDNLMKRHEGRINVIYLDGHIAPLPIPKIPDFRPLSVLFWTGKGNPGNLIAGNDN